MTTIMMISDRSDRSVATQLVLAVNLFDHSFREEALRRPETVGQRI